eukprot:m.59754 g.59754  ORF g.59754 m.59754 type:complete len:419 (+) comp19127_c0_seq1:209-1465(+)
MTFENKPQEKEQGLNQADLRQRFKTAFRNDDAQEVVQLMKEGLPLNDPNTTHFHDAARLKKINIVKVFLSIPNIDIDRKDSLGNTPLRKAVEYGHQEVVNLLLKSGADATARNKIGTGSSQKSETLLHIAVRDGKPEMVEMLARYHAEINALDRYGETPLHVASGKKFFEIKNEEARKEAMKLNDKIVESLLRYGADVSQRCEAGDIALMKAVVCKHEEICKLLIKHGSDPNARNKYGDFALKNAVHEGDCEITEALLKSPCCNVDDVDEMGQSLLHLAAMSGQLGVVQALVNHRAFLNPKIKNKSTTPLQLAAQAASTDIIDFLLKSGAEVKIGEWPSSMAISYPWTKVAQVRKAWLERPWSLNDHNLLCLRLRHCPRNLIITLWCLGKRQLELPTELWWAMFSFLRVMDFRVGGVA